MHTVRTFALAPMVLGFFGFGKKREDAAPRAATIRRVTLQGVPAPVLPAPQQAPEVDPLKQRLLFQGLHEDTNPGGNVRIAKMTCPSCSREFRYFLNSDGKKTVVRCPSCAKTYRQ